MGDVEFVALALVFLWSCAWMVKRLDRLMGR